VMILAREAIGIYAPAEAKEGEKTSYIEKV
jgi:hypothetical protein